MSRFPQARTCHEATGLAGTGRSGCRCQQPAASSRAPGTGRRGRCPVAKIEPFTQPPEEFAGKLGDVQDPAQVCRWSRCQVARRLGPAPRRRSCSDLAPPPRSLAAAGREADGEASWKRSSATATPSITCTCRFRRTARWPTATCSCRQGNGPFPAVLVPFYEPLNEHRPGPEGARHARLRPAARAARLRDAVDRHARLGREDRPRYAATARSRPARNSGGSRSRCWPTWRPTATRRWRRCRRSIPSASASSACRTAASGRCSPRACYEKFACAVWSDPGIVFNEKNSNVNYWEPWYLGYDPKEQRKPGVPSAEQPADGALQGAGRRGRRPGRSARPDGAAAGAGSGGTEDPPRNWQALNHLVAVNKLLGHKQSRGDDRPQDARADAGSPGAGTGVPGVLAPGGPK